MHKSSLNDRFPVAFITISRIEKSNFFAKPCPLLKCSANLLLLVLSKCSIYVWKFFQREFQWFSQCKFGYCFCIPCKTSLFFFSFFRFSSFLTLIISHINLQLSPISLFLTYAVCCEEIKNGRTFLVFRKEL